MNNWINEWNQSAKTSITKTVYLYASIHSFIQNWKARGIRVGSHQMIFPTGHKRTPIWYHLHLKTAACIAAPSMDLVVDENLPSQSSGTRYQGKNLPSSRDEPHPWTLILAFEWMRHTRLSHTYGAWQKAMLHVIGFFGGVVAWCFKTNHPPHMSVPQLQSLW